MSHPSQSPGSPAATGLPSSLRLQLPSARLAPNSKGWKRIESHIPLLLRPLVRAYLLGYVSSVAPRLFTLISKHALRWKAGKKQQDGFVESFVNILRGGMDWHRFPTFCAILTGGSTLLEPLHCPMSHENGKLSRSFASFIAAWLGIKLLQSKRTPGFTEIISSPTVINVETPLPTSDAVPDQRQEVSPKQPIRTVHYAGRTLDLTLFAVTRALDVIFGELWSHYKARRHGSPSTTASSRLVESLISRLTDPAIFALSSALIMWTWFYHPSRLPRAYNKWITSAASVDSRLIEALRRCRAGSLVYGKDTGQAPLLGSMCKDYDWPEAWGDPAKAVPFPCEIVHMGCGPSCERHALSRFARSFKWAFTMYLPLNLLLVLRKPNWKALKKALVSACGSSAFLGVFITLFYYGVCLARTRLGPYIVGRDVKGCQKMDGGLCVGTGCAMCGWSILLENAGRRKDMALFVAPRALATLFPRRYDLRKQWRETAVFAASTAVVFTCALENPKRVRGVLGGVLAGVLKP
ncbi:hypothetical protein NEUTE1DRAFT_147264 [Neurospora tetrasperma FGSC 2508]|uniref:Integral membrane protein n=1 Tax=Neurospora tetrasperma (strain FGSC 2508 / ATCC MYA-4615 / P0657) TaxID=510951 RepID=F8MQN0_NEUT8|nr:uncharacterized protein NEUTE1DRAFT_147264 [Neurospora tetrasperma FGSC 2508]EGO56660.1 hypothetical protein NEUTE1DRAFT_147264 [Neurospora tetrasperma FGSC 2508]